VAKSAEIVRVGGASGGSAHGSLDAVDVGDDGEAAGDATEAAGDVGGLGVDAGPLPVSAVVEGTSDELVVVSPAVDVVVSRLA
jgi:predicted dinucleotide-binding enzyme